LDEKKRVNGGTTGEKKLDGEEVPSRTQGKDGEKKKKSKGKTEKSSKRATK
jgi:hypothetical protein